MKHAPIGPTIAVGDVRPDGTVFVHTHNQNPQALRGQIAMMLGTPVDNVVDPHLRRARATTAGRTAATPAPKTKP